MTKEEIEKEWKGALNDFLNKFNEATKNMTEEEEFKYIKDNKINEKLKQLQKDFQEKYKSTQK